LLFLALAGAADVVSAIFRNTITQLETRTACGAGCPRSSSWWWQAATAGRLRGGIGGDVVHPHDLVISGGLACIVGAGVVAVIYPELRHYRVEHAT
jgi:hypothetical protein